MSWLSAAVRAYRTPSERKVARPANRDLIDPKQVIRERSIEELCVTADEYFRGVADPTPWLTKPFTSLRDAPDLLQSAGQLLAGLRLGKTMTVLDFGAGTCWLTRVLCQLQCDAIACDVSEAALEIGKRLFREQPLLGKEVGEPRFLLFDGKRIDLPDDSVDRIACGDAFHHIPNQREVLAEFARILKPGGIAGFSEPGVAHSQAPQSQMEMRNHGVLENDIDVLEIHRTAIEVGFTRISCKMLSEMELGWKDYGALVRDESMGRFFSMRRRVALRRKAFRNVQEMTRSRAIFFLFKGTFLPDSRSHLGLAHILELEESEYETSVGEPLRVNLAVLNRGTACWLAKTPKGIGSVRLGTHLYDDKDALLDFDFSRHELAHNVGPNESVGMQVPLGFKRSGRFKVAFDLVSENVAWFELLGSEPRYVTVIVR